MKKLLVAIGVAVVALAVVCEANHTRFTHFFKTVSARDFILSVNALVLHSISTILICYPFRQRWYGPSVHIFFFVCPFFLYSCRWYSWCSYPVIMAQKQVCFDSPVCCRHRYRQTDQATRVMENVSGMEESTVCHSYHVISPCHLPHDMQHNSVLPFPFDSLLLFLFLSFFFFSFSLPFFSTCTLCLPLHSLYYCLPLNPRLCLTVYIYISD